MSKKLIFAPGEYYHLYNRGTDKRDIFDSSADYDRFLGLLYMSNSKSPFHIKDILRQSARGPTSGRLRMKDLDQVERRGSIVNVCAYCLMPNHFHLLIREKEAGGISKFMQKLQTGYTMYFNKKHERTGALFQGKFKSRHASDDRYLKYLISYVHLNPIKLIEPKWKEAGIKDKSKAKKYLREYSYSSYLDYLGTTRPENTILNLHSLPDYFETPRDFKSSVAEWLDFEHNQKRT